MAKKKKKSYRGHYCYVCGEIKANEKFSGKGHANHICKKCWKLPAEEKHREATKTKLDRLLKYGPNLSKQNKDLLTKAMRSSDPEIREYAEEIHSFIYPFSSRDSQKRKKVKKPHCPEWQFAPEVPTEDYIGDTNLKDPGALEEFVEQLVYDFENGYFLIWEAVACEEQGLSLTAKQEKALQELICFDEEENEHMWFVGERARPSRPWGEIVATAAPYLLRQPFKTFEVTYGVFFEGWPALVEALEDHGKFLSLPQGAKKHLDVIPEDIQHKLWLQDCYDVLSGIGQEEDINLQTQPDRIEEFIEALQECKSSLEFLGLNLEKMLQTLVMPERDRKIFVKEFIAQLGMASEQDPIAEFL